MDIYEIEIFGCHQPNRRAYFCIYVFCLTLPQMALLEFFSLTSTLQLGIELASAQLHRL